MMKIAAQQPYFLPDFFFFYKIFLSDVFVIADFLLFRKQSPIGRTHLNENFDPKYLTIPITHPADHRPLPIYQQKISHAEPWKSHHLQTIKSLYGKYPYFEYFYPDLQEIYYRDHIYLHKFLVDLIEWLNKILLPGKKVVIASKENLLDISTFKKWLEKFPEPHFLIYPHELGYYQQHFPRYKIIDTNPITKMNFPAGYHPDQMLLILLFLEGPDIIRYFMKAGENTI